MKGMKKRKDGKGDGKRKIVRPVDDTASHTPPARKASAKQKALYRVCAVPWDALTDAEKALGLKKAEEFGADFARDWDDNPTPAAWADMIPLQAAECGIINDVEFDIWRLMPAGGDLRLTAFMLGCTRWRLRYPGKGGARSKAELVAREAARAARRIRKAQARAERKRRGT